MEAFGSAIGRHVTKMVGIELYNNNTSPVKQPSARDQEMLIKIPLHFPKALCVKSRGRNQSFIHAKVNKENFHQTKLRFVRCSRKAGRHYGTRVSN